VKEEEAFVILNSIRTLGISKIRTLIRLFGSACEALKAPDSRLGEIPGFERCLPYWKSWQREDSWRRDLDLVARDQIKLLPFTHSDFPKSLLEISDPPVLLYVRGTLKPQDHRSIAVIGTRHSTLYGNEMADEICTRLSRHGFTIVSGLARGIDTFAHRGALQHGRTLAVIGSGLANIYPRENQELAESIACKGALISEFSMETPPDRQNFPQRNRIVSGMTLATLLIEAPIKSGAMITAQKAIFYGRKLFALPGRADSENFKGNHALIKNGSALLVENAEDILVHFEELFPQKILKPLDGQGPFLDNEEKVLFEKMPNEEISIDQLSILANLPANQILRILMSLVLKNAIKEFPGKIYKKIAAGNGRKCQN
jgi:DNA processing protein